MCFLHVVIRDSAKIITSQFSMFHETIRFCTLSMLKFRNFNVQYNDNANHLINGCRAKCVMTVFLSWRKIKLSELFELAFEGKTPGQFVNDFFNGPYLKD